MIHRVVVALTIIAILVPSMKNFFCIYRYTCEEKFYFVEISVVCFLDFLSIYFGRTLGQLEDDVAPCEAQMENWKTNLAVMASKERQYLQQYNNYKVSIFCYHYVGI